MERGYISAISRSKSEPIIYQTAGIFLSLHLAQIVIILGIYLLMNYYGLFILLSIYGLYVLGVHTTNIIYQQSHKAINNME
jgi:hypothetical protein